ncbi:heme biosynthesis protein HemY [Knoellia sp. Soil729]|uniref:heme biosynthesis protein HemY n=1 Tax=Knoellia sp. Soil729 TaxID=1736394 RepID=UPI000AADE499|nr:heme biosynthesis protein HemY [Knoellia sp. Soil729]
MCGTEKQRDLAERVHVDLPRITADEMSTTQDTEPPPDPTGGRDVDTEFMLRHM